MRLNLSAKASRRFKLLMIIAATIGFFSGLLIPALVVDLRSSILVWVLSPIILALMLDALIVGFYLTFLNKA